MKKTNENPKTLYVAGKFDDAGGRRSGMGEKIFSHLPYKDADYFNGGHFETLDNLISDIGKYKLVYWCADVPNDKPSANSRPNENAK